MRIFILTWVLVISGCSINDTRSECEQGEEVEAGGLYSPLDDYPVDKLNFVGVITPNGNDSYEALVEDPTGQVHRVKEGSAIGQGHDVILSVEEDALVMKARVEGCELAGEGDKTHRILMQGATDYEEDRPSTPPLSVDESLCKSLQQVRQDVTSISSETDGRIEIENIFLEDSCQDVVISGRANNHATVSAFMRNLHGHEGYQIPSLLSIARDGDSSMFFILVE
jgi:hypothetical protein